MEELNVGHTLTCIRTFINRTGKVVFIKDKKYKIITKYVYNYPEGTPYSKYAVIDENAYIFNIPINFFNDSTNDAIFLSPNLLRIRKIKSLNL